MHLQHSTYDVVVLGSGNAGCAAAVAAKQAWPTGRVLLIDAAEADWAGGNTKFTAGAYRTVHHGLADVLPLVSNAGDVKTSAERITLAPYTVEHFTADMQRVTQGKTDPALCNQLVSNSRQTIQWLKDDIGVDFVLSFHRQAYLLEGKQVFWGGICLAVEDGGKGLVRNWSAALQKYQVDTAYGVQATQLLKDASTGAVNGVQVISNKQQHRIAAHSVVLACGGFEASSKLCAKWLGNDWQRAHVRGTPYNLGQGIEMAVRDVGAVVVGEGSGCHATVWDYNTNARQGDLELTNQYTKSGYPLGIMLNKQGQRFVDEGEDMRNFTYAKFGRRILEQPDGVAYQLYDATIKPMLRKEEYADHIVQAVTAPTLQQLADKLAALTGAAALQNSQQFLDTVNNFNNAVQAFGRAHPNVQFNPSVKDGLGTNTSEHQLNPPKSNWARALLKGPFMAVVVTCGITFTFPGLKTRSTDSAVLSATDKPIPNLFAAGELVGGLFYTNYPGGSGLTAGAVFGRQAGRAAVKAAQSKPRAKL